MGGPVHVRPRRRRVSDPRWRCPGVTGAEALYADRGHFGAGPIRIAWFTLALPAVMLNYLGQGVFILPNPGLTKDPGTFNPFYQMAPTWALWPLVILATVATIIASQAAITGSFSVAKQAVQLGFLPRLRVLHTSSMEGQIYVPIVNWGLCIGVVALMLVFKYADKLGDIYGVAVTGTFILNTILFLAVARFLWRTSRWRLAPIGVLFLTVEVAFFSSNIAEDRTRRVAVARRRVRGRDRDDHLAHGAVRS